jgi:lipopolysaccharide export system protein LptA
MIATRRVAALLVASALAMSGAGLHAQPQTSKGPPNALQGFSQNRDEPVHIEASTLEVRDKEKVATFSGNVRVKQGDTGMRCKTLVVFYEQDETDGKGDDKGKAPDKAPEKGKPMQQATPGPGGNQKIKRLEARGGVVVTQKEQTATGELGIFDMATQTITLTGNVVMTQGQNVLKGEKLVVDMATGVSRVESGKNGGGRVQGLFLPSSGEGLNMMKPGGGGAKPAQQGSGAKPAQQGNGAKTQQPMSLRPFN